MSNSVPWMLKNEANQYLWELSRLEVSILAEKLMIILSIFLWRLIAKLNCVRLKLYLNKYSMIVKIVSMFSTKLTKHLKISNNFFFFWLRAVYGGFNTNCISHKSFTSKSSAMIMIDGKRSTCSSGKILKAFSWYSFWTC